MKRPDTVTVRNGVKVLWCWSTAHPGLRKVHGTAVPGTGCTCAEPRAARLFQAAQVHPVPGTNSGPETAFPAADGGRKAWAARHRPDAERRLDRSVFYSTPTRHARASLALGTNAPHAPSPPESDMDSGGESVFGVEFDVGAGFINAVWPVPGGRWVLGTGR